MQGRRQNCLRVFPLAVGYKRKARYALELRTRPIEELLCRLVTISDDGRAISDNDCLCTSVEGLRIHRAVLYLGL